MSIRRSVLWVKKPIFFFTEMSRLTKFELFLVIVTTAHGMTAETVANRIPWYRKETEV